MQSSTMSNWLEGYDSDRPVSDGAWANAWSPVWEDADQVEPALTGAEAEKQMEGMRHNG
jgi:hypothetical protein